MHVAILGAGVVGVTTAYYLSHLGHSVTIIERGATVACGASHANGGQLSYSYTDAFANPTMLWKLPGLALGADPGIKIRGGPHASMLRWGLAFLAQCTHARARKNTLDALRITFKSEHLLSQLLHDLPLEFAYRNAGKLVLISAQKELEAARASCQMKRDYNCTSQVITLPEAQAIEPAIDAMKHNYIGAIHSQSDAIADASAFCHQLCHWLTENSDTTLKVSTEIKSLITHGNVLHAVDTTSGVITTDAAIVCMGAWSTQLLKSIGVRLPIYPVRGYSVSLPSGNATPSVSLTDTRRRIVIGRLDSTVRIAGFADFLGFDVSRDKKRISTLVESARSLAPHAAQYDVQERNEWGGFRPMTPDGLPIVGGTAIKGLFVNSGHGTLGWTMACASGHEVAASLQENQAAIIRGT